MHRIQQGILTKSYLHAEGGSRGVRIAGGGRVVVAQPLLKLDCRVTKPRSRGYFGPGATGTVVGAARWRAKVVWGPSLQQRSCASNRFEPAQKTSRLNAEHAEIAENHGGFLCALGGLCVETWGLD